MWAFGQQLALARQIRAEELRLESAVAVKQDENDYLVAQAEYVKSDEYVEHWARKDMVMIKGDEIERTHHIHVFQAGNPEIGRHLDFMDYLIAHPEEAQAYSRLKQELAHKFPHDIEGYMEGKDGFIKEVDERARAWKGKHARKNLVS